MELHRCEVQHRANACADHHIEHALSRLAWHRQDRDVGGLQPVVLRQRAHIAHGERFEGRADLAGIAVVYGDDGEAALPESAIQCQRAADLAGADDHDAPLAFEAEDLAQPPCQLGNAVAESPLAEGAEHGQVLPDLRRCGARTGGELIARDGRRATGLELLEVAEVQRQPADG
jgi:hypothetical protein